MNDNTDEAEHEYRYKITELSTGKFKWRVEQTKPDRFVDDYWDFLEDKNVLDMEKVATRHIIKINTTNNLGKFLIELTQNYWTSPKDIKERIKKRQTRE